MASIDSDCLFQVIDTHNHNELYSLDLGASKFEQVHRMVVTKEHLFILGTDSDQISTVLYYEFI